MSGPRGRREKSGARRGGRRAGYGPHAAEEVMGAGGVGRGVPLFRLWARAREREIAGEAGVWLL